MQVPPTEISTASSRLCTACGLCCNGDLFHLVKLQSYDSAPELVALGLKLKRKKGHDYLLQPCPAFRDSCCTIYAARPVRCRLFACRQLRRVTAGETTEAEAMEKIREAQRRVAALDALLEEAGGTNRRRPLSKRCEKALAEPQDDATNAAGAILRRRIMRAQRELEALLDADFRVAKE